MSTTVDTKKIYLRGSSFCFEITVTTDLMKWVPIGNQARKVCMKRKRNEKLAIILYKESKEKMTVFSTGISSSFLLFLFTP